MCQSAFCAHVVLNNRCFAISTLDIGMIVAMVYGLHSQETFAPIATKFLSLDVYEVHDLQYYRLQSFTLNNVAL